jgi:dTMP kinase
MRKRALFISFEGGDQCGKSTQIALLKKYLVKKKIPNKVLREPGGTRLGEEIRRLLLHSKKLKLSSFVEFQLFTTARRQLVEEVMVPFIQKTKKGILVLDRFFDSTHVYQGDAGNLSMKKLETIEKASRLGLVPDITFLLDISLKEAKNRQKGTRDRMEKKSDAYHQKVRQGYLKRAKQSPRRFIVIDGTDTPAEIHQTIISRLERRLSH